MPSLLVGICVGYVAFSVLDARAAAIVVALIALKGDDSRAGVGQPGWARCWPLRSSHKCAARGFTWGVAGGPGERVAKPEWN